MEPMHGRRDGPPLISIGILAYNEEDGLKTTLESLFKQTLFAELEALGEWCEVICVANGCVDDTVAVAAEFFSAASSHPHAAAFECRVEDIKEKGKANAVNHFFHRLSHPEAPYLVLMDADILFCEEKTLHSLYGGLKADLEAWVTVGRIYKDVYFKKEKTLFDRISLSASAMTQAGKAQLSGQLYCIRGGVGRNIYFPKGILGEDGFIKQLVCHDFFTADFREERIKKVEDAAHIFEAYKSVSDILRIQKREMTNQVIYHVLIQAIHRDFSEAERRTMARTLRQKEREDPDWLLKAIDAFIRQTRFFWRIHPNALTFRLRRLWSMPVAERFKRLPTALVGTAVQGLACRSAYRSLKDGSFGEWPDTKSQNLGALDAGRG